jgi:hypothetical protein
LTACAKFNAALSTLIGWPMPVLPGAVHIVCPDFMPFVVSLDRQAALPTDIVVPNHSWDWNYAVFTRIALPGVCL